MPGSGIASADNTATPFNPELAMMKSGSYMKQGLDKQVKHMAEVLSDYGHRLDGLIEILDEKLDRNAIEALISDKVDKNEITDLLPNMEAYDQKVESRIEESTDVLWQKLEEKFVAWDQRMIQIRQEFDIVALNKSLDSMARKETVETDFQNHEFKIQTLDRNIVAIATDFETF